MTFPATTSLLKTSSSLFREADWTCCALAPAAIVHPSQLENVAADWFTVKVPGTIAAALRDHGRWNFDQPVDIDASDWWFRTTFSVPAEFLSSEHAASISRLCFDGLATLTEVWLNGESVLTTDNMFRGYQVDVSAMLQPENTLVIVFRSLQKHLQQKRPRPRWKTNLVAHQQLRWVRTSLLGHIPGWSPPVPTVGPWRDIRLETAPVQLEHRQLHTDLEGTTGLVHLTARISTSSSVHQAELRVGNHVLPLNIQPNDSGATLTGKMRIPDVPLWWPHTHGTPHVFPCQIVVSTSDETFHFACPDVGFRKLDVETSDRGFSLRVNHVPIFCRGACWTINDIFTISGTRKSLEHDLRLARDAGMNMLRIGGTMCYESDAFYQLCDRLGILVWQDFAFANMDYPVQDKEFRQNIRHEACEQLQRLASHPSVAVYCGNSEIEQQAAMLGMPRELWTNDWFADELPELCAKHHPGTAYVPSTPTGGALPFQPRAGLTHYYGVGAYLRTIDDVRRSEVRFTPECLGFSHIPEMATVEDFMHGAVPVMHSPQWKRRVPRDTGAGWDFEDVRDHYLRERFQVDPVMLRSHNLPRYLQLSRIVTGELMAQVFSEWRSGHSRTQGALVWFYKDLWPAAGWGIIDSAGLPKAVYYALKRVWNSRQLTVTDEGLNGLHLHLTNETAKSCEGFVQVQLLREPNVVIAQSEVPVHLPPRSRRMLTADEILDRFCDVTYAYRFGPPQHDVVLVTWFNEQHQPISEAFHFIHRKDPLPTRPIAVESSVHEQGDGRILVELCSDSFLYGVHLHARGFLPDQNDFHLGPQRTKEIHFSPISGKSLAFQGELEALNLADVHLLPNITQSETGEIPCRLS